MSFPEEMFDSGAEKPVHVVNSSYSSNFQQGDECAMERFQDSVSKKKFGFGDFQKYLIESPEAAIGLKYIEELRYPTFSEPYFKCIICPAQGYGNTMFRHVFGKKHNHAVLYKGYHIGIGKTNLEKVRREIAEYEGRKITDIKIITGDQVLDEVDPKAIPGLTRAVIPFSLPAIAGSSSEQPSITDLYSNVDERIIEKSPVDSCKSFPASNGRLHITTDVIQSKHEVIFKRSVYSDLNQIHLSGPTPCVNAAIATHTIPQPGRELVNYSDLFSNSRNENIPKSKPKRPRRMSRWSPRTDQEHCDYRSPSHEIVKRDADYEDNFKAESKKKVFRRDKHDTIHTSGTQTDFLPPFVNLFKYLEDCSLETEKDFDVACAMAFPMLLNMFEYQSSRLVTKDGREMVHQLSNVLKKTIKLFVKCNDISCSEQAKSEHLPLFENESQTKNGNS